MLTNINETITEAISKIDGLPEADQKVLAEQVSDLANVLAETKAAEKVARINEDKNNEIRALTERLEGELEDQFSEALSEAAGQFMSDNSDKFSGALKADLAESFLSGIANLFKEHGVLISPDNASLQESFDAKESELAETNAKLLAENVQLMAEIHDIKRASIVENAIADLTILQKERITVVAESLAADDLDLFEKCLINVIEGMTKKKVKEDESDDDDDCDDKGEKDKPKSKKKDADAIDEAVRMIADFA